MVSQGLLQVMVDNTLEDVIVLYRKRNALAFRGKGDPHLHIQMIKLSNHGAKPAEIEKPMPPCLHESRASRQATGSVRFSRARRHREGMVLCY